MLWAWHIDKIMKELFDPSLLYESCVVESSSTTPSRDGFNPETHTVDGFLSRHKTLLRSTFDVFRYGLGSFEFSWGLMRLSLILDQAASSGHSKLHIAFCPVECAIPEMKFLVSF